MDQTGESKAGVVGRSAGTEPVERPSSGVGSLRGASGQGAHTPQIIVPSTIIDGMINGESASVGGNEAGGASHEPHTDDKPFDKGEVMDLTLQPCVLAHGGCLIYKNGIQLPNGRAFVTRCFRCPPTESVVACRLVNQHLARNYNAAPGKRGYDRNAEFMRKVAESVGIEIMASPRPPTAPRSRPGAAVHRGDGRGGGSDEAEIDEEAVQGSSNSHANDPGKPDAFYRLKRELDISGGAPSLYSSSSSSTSGASVSRTSASRRVRQRSGGTEYLDDGEGGVSVVSTSVVLGDNDAPTMLLLNSALEQYPELDPLPDPDAPPESSDDDENSDIMSLNGKSESHAKPKSPPKVNQEARQVLAARIDNWLDVMNSDPDLVPVPAGVVASADTPALLRADKAKLVSRIRDKLEKGGVAALRIEDLEILKSRGLHITHAEYKAATQRFPSSSSASAGQGVVPVVRSVLDSVDLRVQAATQINRAGDFMVLKMGSEQERWNHYSAARAVIRRRTDRLEAEHQEHFSDSALSAWQAEHSANLYFLRAEETMLLQRLQEVRGEIQSAEKEYSDMRQEKAALRCIHRARMLQNEDDHKACEALVHSTASTRSLLETFGKYLKLYNVTESGNAFMENMSEFLRRPIAWAHDNLGEGEMGGAPYWRILHEALRVACTLVHLHTGYNPLHDPTKPLPRLDEPEAGAVAEVAVNGVAVSEIKTECEGAEATDASANGIKASGEDAAATVPLSSSFSTSSSSSSSSSAPVVRAHADPETSSPAIDEKIEVDPERLKMYTELTSLLERCELNYNAASVAPRVKSSGEHMATVVLSDPRTLYHQVPNDLPERSMRVMRIMQKLTQLQQDLTITYDGSPEEGVDPYDQSPVVCLPGSAPDLDAQGLPRLPYFMEAISLVHSDRYRDYLQQRVDEAKSAALKIVPLKDEAGVLDSESEHDFDLDEEKELDVSFQDAVDAGKDVGEVPDDQVLKKLLNGEDESEDDDAAFEGGAAENDVASGPPPPKAVNSRRKPVDEGSSLQRIRVKLQVDKNAANRVVDKVLVLPSQPPESRGGENMRTSRKYSVKVNRLGIPNESAIALLSCVGLPENTDVPEATDRISLWEKGLNRLSNSGPHFRNLREHLNRSPNLVIWAGQGKRNEATIGHLRSLVWLRRALLEHDATAPLPKDFFERPGEMVGEDVQPEPEAERDPEELALQEERAQKRRESRERDRVVERDRKRKWRERKMRRSEIKNRRGLTKKDFLTRTWGPDDRVTLWHVTKHYKVAGRNTPCFKDLQEFLEKKPEFVVYRGQDLKDDGDNIGTLARAGDEDGESKRSASVESVTGLGEFEERGELSNTDDMAAVTAEKEEVDATEVEREGEGEAQIGIENVKNGDSGDIVTRREMQPGEVVVMPSKAQRRREEEERRRKHEGEQFVAAFGHQQSKVFPFKNTTIINGRRAIGNAFITHEDKEELVCPAGWWEDLESPASDTYLSPRSMEAALAASEIVCKAVDLVHSGAADGYDPEEVPKIQNVFCCIRPPGHHSGRYGNTAGCGQNGFCLLNNVAIAATYARIKYGLRRYAVIDIDAHFGNGTAEIVANDPHAFYSSVHLQYEMPGRFFPSSACCTVGADVESPNLVLVNVYPPTSKTSQSLFSKTKVPRGRGGFRRALFDSVYPAVRAFEPDIIFLSAGFDGSHTDPIGGHLGLRPEDFHHISQEIKNLADEICGGRLISVLEGGYDLDAKTDGLATCVEAHVLALAGCQRN